MIEPAAGALHTASASGPTHSGTKMTGLPMISDSLSATGFSVIEAFFLPSGRPRCDMSTTA